jgi:flagellar basal-body rod modification protein FlgD
MAIGNVQNTSTLTQTTSTTATPAAPDPNGGLGKDAFMKLLIAQLKNQDPLNPTDSKDFVTQLSTLTSVEKMGAMADQLGALQVATSSMVANQASNLVGKSIEGDGKTLYLGAAGAANSGISLSEGAASVSITIRDAKGVAVRTIKDGAATPGTHAFSWDGKLDSGERAPTGKYSMEVTAKNSSGASIPADAKVSGVVTAVSYERGFPELLVGNTSVALANVTKISN